MCLKFELSMITSQITHKIEDYWFDKTIEKYIPNSRQRFEINSELKIFKPEYIFNSEMIVLFHGSWGSNKNQVFCKIQVKSAFIFKTDNLKIPMVTESIWLFLKQQYQLAINVFRQDHWGTLILPTHIDVNALNEEVYTKIKEKYKDYLWFESKPPFGISFKPYW